MLLSRDLSEFSYYRAFLRWRKPKFVITMEDNNPLFYATKELLPTCKTLAVQNGLRTPLSDSPQQDFRQKMLRHRRSGWDVDVMATLGGLGTHFFKEALPDSSATLVEVGSLINNGLALLRERTFTTPKRVVFISKFPNFGSGGLPSDWAKRVRVYVGEVGLTDEQYFKVDVLVAQTCARIALEMGLSFAVLGKRPLRQPSEFGFYAEHLSGMQWEYLPSTSQAASYEAVSADDIIVNIDSTMGYELFARGLRVVSIAARMQACGYPELPLLRFGYPLVTEESGPFWSSSSSESEIRRLIGMAASASVEEWGRLTQPLRQLLFRFDPYNTRLCSALHSLGIRNSGPSLWARELIPLN
jgi:surface carbohydrate biosynthesis protein